MKQRQLGPYELISELGRGGMGVVYRARHLELRREVALKVPLGELEGQRRERFLREAQVTAHLDHPGIVRIHEVGEAEGRPFLAYELIEGAEPIDRAWRPLATEARVRLVVQAARALGYAHARGVVHRDIKTENLLVDAAGQVRVADFGVAQAQGLDRLTRSGQFVGTPSYAAPEQIFGERGEVGPASDVWALGVVLYQALTGELPFPEQEPRLLAAQIMRSDPSSPHALDPRVPTAVSRACLQALQKDAPRRPPHGDAFADLLEQALLEPTPRVTPRRIAAGALALALGLGGLVAALESPSRPAPASTATPTAGASTGSPAPDPAHLPRDIPRQVASLRIDLPGAGIDLEVRWADADTLWITDERRQVWCYTLALDRPEATLRQRWTLPDPEPPRCEVGLLTVAADRAWTLTTTGVWELTAGQPPKQVLEGKFDTLAPGLAPGDVLAASLDELVLLDPQGRLSARRYRGPGRVGEVDCMGLMLRLDDTRYVTQLKQSLIRNDKVRGSEALYTLQLGAEPELLAWVPDAPSALALDLRGGRCVFATFGGRVTCLSLETWQPLEHLRVAKSPEPDVRSGYLPEAHPGSSVTALAVAGDRLYSVSAPRRSYQVRGEVVAWSLSGTRLAQVGTTLEGSANGYRSIDVQPGGAWVALGTGDGSVEVWPRERWSP